MFDLATIEQDWLNNSHALSESEILNLFMEDFATIPQYNESIEEWHRNMRIDYPEETVEEKFLHIIYGDKYEQTPEYKKRCEEIMELYELKIKEFPEPHKKHLSKENQKKVVDGSMHLVFKYVKHYYAIFEHKISEETLYYLLLETLINVAKYMVHCGNPVFHLYVISSFEKRIIKYISHIEKVSYDEARVIVHSYERTFINIKSNFLDEAKEITQNYSLVDLNKEVLVSPFELKFLMRNHIVEDSVFDKLKTEDFFKFYNNVLNQLNDEEKIVMQLSYDSNGYPGLTYGEIAEYLGIEKEKVKNIKRRALMHIRKNSSLKLYDK